MITVTLPTPTPPAVRIYEFSDCRNNSSAVTESDIQVMRAMYEQIVAHGTPIPPHIEQIAKSIGIA